MKEYVSLGYAETQIKSWTGFNGSTGTVVSQQVSHELNWLKQRGLKFNSFSVQVKEDQNLSFWAQSTLGLIMLRSGIEATQKTSILRHELVHQVLLHQCAQIKDEVLHEATALWLSEDYLRLVSSNEAHSYFNDAIKNIYKDGLTTYQYQQMLARIFYDLNVEQKKKLDLYLLQLVQNCQGSRAELIELLKGRQSHVDLVQAKIDFILYDFNAKEVIFAEGDYLNAKPVGSVLKPLLLSQFNLNELPILKAKNTVEYECFIKKDLWSWTDALINSCNGYFLDLLKKQEYFETAKKTYQDLFKFELSDRESAIGLSPKIALSLLQLIKAYDVMSYQQPLIWKTLRATSQIGTLSLESESSWFSNRQIALKSGTVRNVDESPEYGYIVGAIMEQEYPQYIFAIRANQMAPLKLLAHLKDRLVKLPQIRKQNVEVLNLVKNNSFHFGCESGRIFDQTEQKFLKHQILMPQSDFLVGHDYVCLNGPWLAQTTHFQKSLYGSLKKVPTQYKDQGNINISEKQKLARSDSPWVLTTSSLHYVKSVIIQEFSQATREMKLVLAKVIEHNGLHPRHQFGPCDSTHCQFYKPENISFAKSQELSEIIFESQKIDYSFKEPWLMFYLGGESEWESKITFEDLKTKLNLTFSPVSMRVLEQTKNLDTRSNFTSQNAFSEIWIEGSSGQRQSFKCDQLMTAFKLLGCRFKVLAQKNYFRLTGQGEGHGIGLNLSEANLLTRTGLKSEDILKKYFK